MQAGIGACRRDHLAWNWEEIAQALADSPAAVLYLAGTVTLAEGLAGFNVMQEIFRTAADLCHS